MSKETQEQLALIPGAKAVPTEQELLAQWGFIRSCKQRDNSVERRMKGDRGCIIV